MYNEYFGFKEAPFSIAPDPRYLYMTAQHREALAHLVYGLNSEGGCILLTGEVGTGKTTICRCLLEQIPEQANVALVLNPKVSEIELLESICDELKIDYPDATNSAKTYTDRIYEFLLTSNQNNEKTVLIIDEAQNLSSKVLEQLRLLTNLETNQRKLLQIIILGQPELLDILSRSEMRQLAQRITARFHLHPLTRHEVKAYVSHRLAIAGQNIQLFPDKSIKLLYKLSNGIPRLINIICDRALLGTYVENKNTVIPETIKKAAKEVFGELKNVEEKTKIKRWLYPVITLTCFIIATLGILFYFINTQEKTKHLSLSSQVFSETHTKEIEFGAGNKNNSQETLNGTIIKSNEENNTVSTSVSNKAKLTNETEKNLTLIDTGTTYDNIDTILSSKENNHASAYQQLFNAWGHHYDTETSITACKQATAYSLSCLHKQGNINSLKIHNRPAVLTLINKQGEARHITITSIKKDAATIYSNSIAYTVKLNELDKYWYGQFVLLWKKPSHYLTAISPGDGGQIINWLNIQLRKINDTPSAITTNAYNYSLVGKIIAFQSQQGLIADGIVGPVTIIHLNTQSGLKVPALMPMSSLQLTKQG